MAERDRARDYEGPRLPGPGGGRAPGGPGGPGGGARWLQGAEKARDRRATMQRLWSAFGASRRRLYVVALLVLLDAAVLLAVPLLVGASIDAMDGVLAATARRALAAALAALLAAWAADLVLVLAQGWIMARASQEIVGSLRRGLFAKLGRLSLSLFDSWSHGDLMSRLTNDVDNISGSIAQSTTQLISTVVMIGGSLVLMLSLSPLLTLAALVTVPLVFVLTRTVSRRTRVLFRSQQAVLGALNGQVEESISGMEVVKAFGREELETATFDRLNESLREVGTKAQIWSGFIMPLMNVINNIGLAALALAGGFLAARGSITVGVIASFIAYSRQFTRPLNELANTWNTLQSAIAGAERVFEVMDLAEETGDRPGARLSVASRSVSFERVSFGYVAGRPVVNEVSLEAPEGSVTALVGPTGAGKTTLVSLLTRFCDADSGAVLLGGVDLRDYSRDALRSCFGVVLQDSYLFSGSIRENILYAKPGAGEDELLRAARTANADHFIDRLPHGYDTPLGEGGTPLSEGQRQLVSIARAVLADPAILVLDEATSSVDTRTELHIQEAMLALMAGRTTFVIAHRLSTIRDADRILVVDGGRIVESGSHAELLAAGGLYAQMYSSQSRGLITP